MQCSAFFFLLLLFSLIATTTTSRTRRIPLLSPDYICFDWMLCYGHVRTDGALHAPAQQSQPELACCKQLWARRSRPFLPTHFSFFGFFSFSPLVHEWLCSLPNDWFELPTYITKPNQRRRQFGLVHMTLMTPRSVRHVLYRPKVSTPFWEGGGGVGIDHAVTREEGVMRGACTPSREPKRRRKKSDLLAASTTSIN